MRGLSAEQWLDLLAYYRAEPFGYEMENLRPAIIASTVATVNSKKPIPPSEFMPKFDKPSPKTLNARIRAAMQPKE